VTWHGEIRKVNWSTWGGIAQGAAWHSHCQRQSQTNFSDCTWVLAAL